MSKELMPAVKILRWTAFLVLFAASVLFLIYCIAHSDRRLFPAAAHWKSEL